jgi:Zinc-binding dehydrogenase
MRMMLAEMNAKDLTVLADLVQTGKLKPVIDKTYPFSQLPEAMRYLEEGHARGKVVVTIGDTIEPLAPSPNSTAVAASTPSPILIVLGLVAIPAGVLILPIIAAFVLNRRFKRRNPEARGFRWGYYFSIMSVIAGLVLGLFLEAGAMGVIICGILYLALAWFFAHRHRWAWITLTILSFNPIAWIINVIYLWRRWREASVVTATT